MHYIHIRLVVGGSQFVTRRRFCGSCRNAVKRSSAHDERIDKYDATGYLQDVSCAVFAKFDSTKDADMWRTHDLLAAEGARLGTTAMKELEQRHGLSLNTSGQVESQRFLLVACMIRVSALFCMCLASDI